MPSPLTLPVRYTTRKPPVGAPIRGGLASARGLALFCPLNEGAGGTAHDATAYRRNGTLSGDAKWAGQALSFDGGTGLVAGTSPFAGLSHATWFSRVLISSSAGAAATWYSGNTAYSNSFLLARDSGASGSATSGQAFIGALKTNFVVLFDVWQDVVVTLDGSTVTIYVAGRQVAQAGGAAAVPAHTGYQVGANTATSLPFGGQVAFYGGYARALSPAEVRSLYVAPFQVY